MYTSSITADDMVVTHIVGTVNSDLHFERSGDWKVNDLCISRIFVLGLKATCQDIDSEDKYLYGR